MRREEEEESEESEEEEEVDKDCRDKVLVKCLT